MDNADAAILD